MPKHRIVNPAAEAAAIREMSWLLVSLFAPHAAHALPNVDLRLCNWRGAFCLARNRPAHAVEVMGQGCRNEPAAPGKDMPISGAGLLMGIEALRHNQVQFIFRP